MSTLPPGTPPPLTSNPLPWEDRDRRGIVQAFFDTVGVFVTRPAEAWSRTAERGDLASALMFGTGIAWISFVVHSILARIIVIPFVLPGALGRRWGALGSYGPVGPVGFVLNIVLAPVIIAIVLFVGSAILHVCSMIVGALSGSRSGFEGSFRVVAYSEVSSLASIVPVVGHVIAIVWWIVLAIMGVQRLHRTTQGKATAAVLIPVIVCCGGVILIAMLVATAIFVRH